MKWVRNEAAESFFERNKIPFRFVEGFPFADVNMKGCLKTQSRVLTERLNQDLVTQYAMNMLDGAAFHAPVLCKNGKGYISPDGLHRLSAFEESGLARTEGKLNAYVLDTDDEMLLRLATRCLNRTNGWQQSRPEAVEQAMLLVDEYPTLSHEAVAREFGISGGTLSKALQARDTKRALHERRVNADKLPTESLVTIGRLGYSEPVMAVVADVAVRRSMTVNDVKRLVAIAKEHRSEEKAIAAVQAVEDEIDRKSPKPVERRTTIKTNFTRSLTLLYNIVCKNPTLEHLQLTSKSEATEAKRAWDRLRDILDAAFGVIK